ncbi:glutamine-transport ABC transporter transmembrane protein, partial [Mycobacterium tuberculosis 2485AR]
MLFAALRDVQWRKR